MIHHRDFGDFKGNKFDGIIAPIHQCFVEGIQENFIEKCKKSFLLVWMAERASWIFAVNVLSFCVYVDGC